MNLENQSATVKAEAKLTLPKSTTDQNTDIIAEKCRCSENSTCEYCCLQEYKKAWRVLQQQPLILSRTKGTICRSETENKQELPDYSYGIEYVTEEQTKKETSVKSDTDGRFHKELEGTKDIDFQSETKQKVNWDTDFKCCEVQNYIHSEETKDTDFNYIPTQSAENCRGDRATKDFDCSLEAASKQEADAGIDGTDIGSRERLTTIIDHLDSDTNTCLSEETKDADIYCSLERSNESCDNQTDVRIESLQKRSSRRGHTEVFTDSVGESCKRTRRNSKRKRDAEDSCPVCGVTIRSCELMSHFDKEVENLSKIHKNTRKACEETGVNTTFVQVKCNRENRLAAKIAKYGGKNVNQVECPVCCVKLHGTEEENNEHVLNCSQDSDVDILEREDSFQEYEFGNETRVRAISLVPGGYKALHGLSSSSKSVDSDEDLNVDIDDTVKYGKPQYTELDVIHNLSDAAEAEQLEQLRKAVIDPSAEPNVLESRKWTNSAELNVLESRQWNNSAEIESEVRFIVQNVAKEDSKNENLMDKTESAAHDTIVSSLKEKIKSLEDQSKNVKCLICLECYTKPVVSTACWHVYCEECWLMTMGVKKLCPQCNMIVFPSDLRRIYL